jgi:hypothetical protein
MHANNNSSGKSVNGKQQKKREPLDPIAARAIKLIQEDKGRALHGPIHIRGLWTKLPRRTQQQVWSYAVEVLILEKVIDAYRWREGTDPLWPGPLYVLNYTALSKEYQVSRTTLWRCIEHLEELGLIGVSTTNTMSEKGKVVPVQDILGEHYLDNRREAEGRFRDN